MDPITATINAIGLALDLANRVGSQVADLQTTFSNLSNNMRIIQTKLQVMQDFFHQRDMYDERNATIPVSLITQAQNLAYKIQDFVNEYKYIVSGEKFDGTRFFIKKLFTEPTSIVALKTVAAKMETAKMELDELANTKDQWVDPPNVRLGENPSHSRSDVLSSHFHDENELVGLESYRNKLIEMLHSEHPTNEISVWGMPGVGKTTLVTNAYQRVKGKFNCYAWVSISKHYSIDDTLRKLISEIVDVEGVSINTSTMNLRKLKEKTIGLLKGKKYLIVLDDVWNQNAFYDLRDVFANSNSQSRVVITTQTKEVASIAEKSRRLKIKCLGDSESWELFSKKAFPRYINCTCPQNLMQWASKIVAKCDGLPLTLASIGRYLSSRENETDWKGVHDQLSVLFRDDENLSHVRSILKSFHYLQGHLKNCFLYCCIFPENHLLARKKLIRLWIAEGLIAGSGILEDVAEGYLNELIDRNMLQLVEKNDWGRVRRCRVHYTIRDLAINCLFTKINFGLVCNNKRTIETNTRRLTVVESINEIEFEHNHDTPIMPHLRAFLLFDNKISGHTIPDWILKCRYLAILELHGLKISTIPETIGELFNLHYLGLRDTKVLSLPKSIKKLHHLQTLDLCGSEIKNLPSEIEYLTKLRHLFAEKVSRPTTNFLSRTGVRLRKGLSHLTELQTLQGMDAVSSSFECLESLTQLRSFRILNVTEWHCNHLSKALSKMTILATLDVNASHENEFLRSFDLPLPLRKLTLKGRLREETLEMMVPDNRNLRVLNLWWSRLTRDPLALISRASCLTNLYLNKAYDGNKLVFHSGWFPKLTILTMRELVNLRQVKMERDTMEIIEKIVFINMKQLEIPEGIQYLKSLKEMDCSGVSANFARSARQQSAFWSFDCNIISHDPPQE